MILTSVWIGLHWVASFLIFCFGARVVAIDFFFEYAMHLIYFSFVYYLSRVCDFFLFRHKSVALKNNAFFVCDNFNGCLIFVFFNKIILSFFFPFNLSVNSFFFHLNHLFQFRQCETGFITKWKEKKIDFCCCLFSNRSKHNSNRLTYFFLLLFNIILTNNRERARF